MRRVFQAAVLGAALSATPWLLAQRSTIEFHGIPASVTSPRVDGTFRGIPASVTDPTFRPSPSVSAHGTCCRHQHRHSSVPLSAVPYYGYYPYYYDSSMAYEQAQPPAEQEAPPPQVIIIKDERAANDVARSGQPEFDPGGSYELPARNNEIARAQPAPAPAAQEEQLPMTTLVYRDGHKSELRNYAIVGSNLIDLTKSSLMKKIPLASLDLEATRRENEENGVDFHLP